MRRKLPPLMAVRAFEAAGRHLSFTVAAEELFVTQSAISRHIRNLEDFLNEKLFIRLPRELVLTPFGADYLVAISRSLDMIEKATLKSGSGQKQRVLTLDVMQSLATTWLIPRLANFKLETNIHVRVDTSIKPINFDTDQIDVAVRLGKLPGSKYRPDQPRIDFEMVKSWSNVQAEFIAHDVLVPVCSPSLLSRGRPLETPADLANHTLIHNLMRPLCWSDWFHSLGIPPVAPKAEIELSHFFIALQAARDGLGVAIVPSLFVDNSSNEQELVQPLRRAIPSAGEYYLLFKESSADDPSIRSFRHWVQRQVPAGLGPGLGQP